jgi:hypothetical protein
VSIPLKDYRTGIPESVDVWLDIESAATGKDKAQIGRDVLTAWAKEKFHAHKVATKRLQANGMQPELFGDEPADDGKLSGKARK